MNKIKIFIGVLFVSIGLILIAIPLHQDFNKNKEIKALEEALFLISEPINEDVAIDLSSIENLTLSTEEIKDILELEIPFIQLRQYVLNETTDANLNIALTQIKKNQTPGEGNFTIAGHRGYRDGRHFSNLAKVPVGEKIYLHTGNETYTYEIISSEVIEPTFVEVLNDKPEKNEITLITCTVSGAKRVAVRGELVDSSKEENVM